MSYLAQALRIQASSGGGGTKTMEVIFRQSLEEISRAYAAGLIGFIKTFHPELWQKVIDLEGEIEKAWPGGELESLRKASREYVELFHRGKENYLRTGTGRDSEPFSGSEVGLSSSTVDELRIADRPARQDLSRSAIGLP